MGKQKRKPDLARNLSYTMLYQVLEEGAYSHIIVQNYLRDSALEGRDRSFSLAVFYGTLTRLYTIDFYLGKCVKKGLASLEPSVRTILRMGGWQLLFSDSVPDFAAVNESVSLLRLYSGEGAAKLGNGVLRALCEMKKNDLIHPEKEKFDVRFSLNKELSGCLKKWYGEDRASEIMEAFFSEPTVCIRPNIRKVSKNELADILKNEGIDVEDGLFLSSSLRISLKGRDPALLPSFADGLFSMQDEAASLAGFLAAPRPGCRVLDVCAAPGGKSCHMAELMEDTGVVIAVDIHEKRLGKIRENKDRLNLSCIREYQADASSLKGEASVEPSSFDVVLADVPCSGLGLLKKKPDIRHTMTYDKMEQMIPIQKEILREASLYVKPGGRLIYSTCTINPKENQKQVENFLRDNPMFEPEDLSGKLWTCAGEHAKRHQESAENGWIQMSPDIDKCDGFFVSGFIRKDPLGLFD